MPSPDSENESQTEIQINYYGTAGDSVCSRGFAVDKSDLEEVASVIARQAALALSEGSTAAKPYHNQNHRTIKNTTTEDYTTQTQEQLFKAESSPDARSTMSTIEESSDCSETAVEAAEVNAQSNGDMPDWSCGALFCNAF
jgi:hypothetical protein